MTPGPYDGVTSAVGGVLDGLGTLITDNLGPILTVAAIILAATVVWRLVKRFVK